MVSTEQRKCTSRPRGPRVGVLFLVPTPIGHVGDLSPRAIETLRAASVVAAEDTRKARTLLAAVRVKARLVSYYDLNEQARTTQLLEALRSGQDVALITDAGTPLINDPGYRIVSAAIEDGIRICPLPGPSAVLTALIGSGLGGQRFEYAGFLPRKSSARKAAIRELAGSTSTLIFFEAPHRLLNTLADLAEVLGDRQVALARNLTKSDEEFLRGLLSQVAATLSGRAEVRGEFTVVLAGATAETGRAEAEELAGRLIPAMAAAGVEPHAIRSVVKEVGGLPRNRVYELVAQALKP